MDQSKLIFIHCFLTIFLLHFSHHSKSVTAQKVEDQTEFNYSQGGLKGPRRWGDLKQEWAASSPVAPTPAPIDPVDMLLLVQSWPPGYCSQRSCNPTRASIQHFMIHGLWPVNKSGHGLTKGGLDTIDPTTIINDHLCQGISTYWQNLSGLSNSDDYKFWEYEWSKHGRADNSIEGYLKYFEKTMQLRQLPGANDPLGALRANNINPGSSYKKGDYVRAIEAKTGITDSVIIRCNTDGNVYIFQEFYICVDRQGVKFASCNQNGISSKDNCGNNPIMFV